MGSYGQLCIIAVITGQIGQGRGCQEEGYAPGGSAERGRARWVESFLMSCASDPLWYPLGTKLKHGCIVLYRAVSSKFHAAFVAAVTSD